MDGCRLGGTVGGAKGSGEGAGVGGQLGAVVTGTAVGVDIVGAFVGLTEGGQLGVRVGSQEGTAVGDMLGMEVGSPLGVAVVGAAVVGVAVGAPVGCAVGRVGALLGVREGGNDGMAVGRKLGVEVVGMAVGVPVGAGVGVSEGELVVGPKVKHGAREQYHRGAGGTEWSLQNCTATRSTVDFAAVRKSELLALYRAESASRMLRRSEIGVSRVSTCSRLVRTRAAAFPCTQYDATSDKVSASASIITGRFMRRSPVTSTLSPPKFPVRVLKWPKVLKVAEFFGFLGR